jgi:hypothetical protein
VRRQDLLQLDQRAHRGLLDPRDGRAGRRPQPDRDRDRLVVVEQERRHRRARMEPVAARGAGRRLHGVPELAQPLDVAPHGSSRHLEPPRQLVPRPVAPRLEEREQLQEPAGGRGHRGQILTHCGRKLS